MSPSSSFPRFFFKNEQARQELPSEGLLSERLDRIIHDRFVAKSLRRVVGPARGALRPRCVLVQYGEGPRGEPAGRRLVVAADQRLQQKRHE